MFKEIDINKIKKGDSKAFKALFELFYPKLVSHACRFVDKHTAGDLVQDLFTSYWEQKDKIEADNLLSFLYKCLHNSCLDYLKHQNVVKSYEAKIALAEQRAASMETFLENNDILKQIISQNIYEIVEQSIKKLPPRSAEAFRLRYFNDLTHKEIAEIMNISQRTVETHIYNVISHLRKDLRGISFLLSIFYIEFKLFSPFLTT